MIDSIVVPLATLAGTVAGYYLATIHSRQVMILIFHLPFRFWRPYLTLYDGLESHYTYELLGGKERFKSHKEFLNKYRKQRQYVTNRFRRLWNAYAKQVGRDYGVVLIVGLGLFWRVWWAFLGPLVLVGIITFTYGYIAKKYRPDFLACVLLSVMF